MRDLPGIEEDDDMRNEELEELFGLAPEARAGGGAEDPVNLADGEDEEQGGENNADEVSRPSTSDVWLISRSSSNLAPKVSRSGMALCASTAIRSMLVDML